MDKTIVNLLKKGEIGVLPTDILYGLAGLALFPKVVRKIYRNKKRDLKKPFIILIAEITNLNLFNIHPDKKIKNLLQKIWPGPVSIILPCDDNKFRYLHRDTNSLAFRIPDKCDLLEIIRKAGPLVAPNANFEGEPPAKTIDEAKRYFGLRAKFYIDQGELSSKPSTLIKIENNKIKIIRKGAYNLSSVRLDKV